MELYGIALWRGIHRFLMWLFNSLYVIKEWERGVVLRLGGMQPVAKGAGLRLVFFPIETLDRGFVAHGNPGCAPAGHDHSR